MRRLCLLLIVFACAGCMAAGCGDSMPESFLTLVFPDAGAEDQTTEVELYVIVPGTTARCGPLRDGSAKPYEQDYYVETSMVYYPPQDAKPSLTDVGMGGRLFFARARDDQNEFFLRACTEVETQTEAGRDIELVFVRVN